MARHAQEGPGVQSLAEAVLLCEAIESGSVDRETALEASTPALREAVESMLDATGVPGATVLPHYQPRGRIDRFALVRQLGAGAHGDVFLSVEDEPTRREVALKILRVGASPVLRARWIVEVRALASMSHPFIASVFDCGVTCDGRPYMSMEYVEGLPLDKAAKQWNLDTVQRLKLVCKVCDAIQHAHQRGFLHRDLKPSNIMVVRVDGRFEPRVIDFGIARALSAERVDLTGDCAVGTVAYMSPEQMFGQDCDTRSDVFSIGVVLFELLAGRLPFVQLDTPQEMLRRRMNTLNDPPSAVSHARKNPISRKRRRADEDQRARAIWRDLDAIVAKTLQRAPANRYQSPRELRVDLVRALKGEAVGARAGEKRYQILRGIHRHRRLVAFGLAALAIGIFFFLSAEIEGWRAGQYLRHAESALSRGDLELASTHLKLAERLGASGPRHLKVLRGIDGSEKRSAVTDLLADYMAERIDLEAMRSGLESTVARTLLREQQEEGGDEASPSPDDSVDIDKRWFDIEDREAKHDSIWMRIEGRLRELPQDKDSERLIHDALMARLGALSELREQSRARMGTASLYEEWHQHIDDEDWKRPVTIQSNPCGSNVHVFRWVDRLGKRIAVGFDPSDHRELRDVKQLDLEGVLADSLTASLIREEGNFAGVTPLDQLHLPCGDYLVVITKEGYRTMRVPLNVRVGAAPVVSVGMWLDDIDDGHEWCHVAGGLATLGGDRFAEDPHFGVDVLTSDFCMGRTEVTVAQYLRFLNSPEVISLVLDAPNPMEHEYMPAGYLQWLKIEGGSVVVSETLEHDAPIITLTWTAANAYVEWMNRKAEQNGWPWEYALPTAAQWARAARGIDGRCYPWGDAFWDGLLCHSFSSSRHKNTFAVGSILGDESPFGVMDMAGRTWEWLADWARPPQLRARPRAQRGGNWNHSDARRFRATSRTGAAPQVHDAGFRLVSTRTSR